MKLVELPIELNEHESAIERLDRAVPRRGNYPWPASLTWLICAVLLFGTFCLAIGVMIGFLIMSR